MNELEWQEKQDRPRVPSLAGAPERLILARGEDRRQVTRDAPGRRLLDRIRDLDPSILECGPECLGHEQLDPWQV